MESRNRRRRQAVAAILGTLLFAFGAQAAPDAPRIITLTPHATEILHAAGGAAHLVGTVVSSDFPPSARQVPRVGDGITVNAERILVLQPTHLIAWQRTGAAREAEALASRIGAKVVYSTPARLRDIPAEVRRVADLLGTQETGMPAAKAMEARIAALEARHAGLRPVTVFIEVSSLPLYTIGGDPLLNDALRVCGAVNLYGGMPAPGPLVSMEDVLVRNPDLLVAPAREKADIEPVRGRWAAYGLAAAIDGRVHGADPDALFRPGPRLIDATEALCAAVDDARRQGKMNYP